MDFQQIVDAFTATKRPITTQEAADFLRVIMDKPKAVVMIPAIEGFAIYECAIDDAKRLINPPTPAPPLVEAVRAVDSALAQVARHEGTIDVKPQFRNAPLDYLVNDLCSKWGNLKAALAGQQGCVDEYRTPDREAWVCSRCPFFIDGRGCKDRDFINNDTGNYACRFLPTSRHKAALRGGE